MCNPAWTVIAIRNMSQCYCVSPKCLLSKEAGWLTIIGSDSIIAPIGVGKWF